jgi:O-antigen/teichoic acid export membrane protein
MITLKGLGLRRRGAHVKNVGSYIIARIVAIALYLVPVALFIRHHGSASYGTLTLLLLVFSYSQFFDLGVGYAVNQRLGRAVARNSSRRTVIVQSAVPLFVLFAIVLSTSIFLLASRLGAFLFGRTEHVDALRTIAIAMGLLTLDALPVSVLQAYNRVDWINYSRLVIDIARAIGICVGAFVPNGLMVAVAFTFGGVIAKTLVDLILSNRLLAIPVALKPRFALRSSTVNMRLGLPMVISVLLGMLMTSADRVFVGRVFGKAALAHYAVGADVCSRAYFLVWAVTGSVYTLYVRRRATRKSADDLIRVSLISVGIVAIGFYLPLAMFAKQIIGIWISPAFAAGSVAVTRVWAAAALAYLVMCVYYNHLRGFGKPGVLAASGVIGVVTLGAGLWTLPRWFDVTGVALAVFLGFSAQAIFLWQWSQRARRRTAA